VIENLIDVWNLETFDKGLLYDLRANVALIRNYVVTNEANFLKREASTPKGPYLMNPYGERYQQFLEDIGRDMEARTIRAWHYTRLIDAEVGALRRGGIYPSTLERIRQRLDAQVTADVFSAELADALFAASPFHHPEQCGPRSNKFWMTSQPVAIEGSGVELLLGNWGGEGVYFWLQDAKLKELVAGIGKPRVLEMAVPLNATRHAYSAAEAIVATFGRTLGLAPYRKDFDLYVTCPLGPDALFAIHTEGEPRFTQIGKEYPASFWRTEE
jgi:hypothetical protein